MDSHFKADFALDINYGQTLESYSLGRYGSFVIAKLGCSREWFGKVGHSCNFRSESWASRHSLDWLETVPEELGWK